MRLAHIPVLIALAAAPALAQCPDPSRCPINTPAAEIKWGKIMPELGPDGPEIAILRVDPKTQATALMIRSIKAMPVPWHWHTANETHTVLAGTFTAECEGKKAELGPGSFNFIPARAIHRAWMTDNCTLYITVDGAWDLNWVEGPPQPEKPGATPPPAPPTWDPATLRFNGVIVEAIEVTDAHGRADPARSKRIEDPAALKKLLAALEPKDVAPSGGKDRWVLNLYAGKGGFLNQLWVFDYGEWGYAGASRGSSGELAKMLGETLGTK